MVARYNARFGIAGPSGDCDPAVCRICLPRLLADSVPMTRPRSSAPTSSGRPARLAALHLAPDSLGFALDAAAQAVDAVRRGTALPAALSTVFAQMPSGAQALARGATQDVAYRTMRRLGSADWLIGKFVSKAPLV